MFPPESWQDWVAEAVMFGGVLIGLWLLWDVSTSRRR
jgi:hypothetical protein